MVCALCFESRLTQHTQPPSRLPPAGADRVLYHLQLRTSTSEAYALRLLTVHVLLMELSIGSLPERRAPDCCHALFQRELHNYN